ncbi:hypothetical protein GMORB2_0160 [Geosmithia morbida]|uniref:Uncharacterized protein n=1 Tax=Geosmithia morbida TaxID=1094350 RepID=A0A9P5D9E0_9HYPO|nr:uncharacterized protein GMORB2_0160 [Geosmithia morbida]KAF4126424.1 hypothetical protein GMORB2_0160 [Geosmithia morbida]
MQPPKPPKGPPSSKAVRAEEIRASLEALDANARRVAATTATEKDLDMMMTNMETESTPAMEQMVGQSIARAPDFSRHVAGDVPPGGGGPGGGPPGRVLPPLSRKEVWVAKIESVLAGELVDLKGYDAYVAATRQRYLAQLEMAQREA